MSKANLLPLGNKSRTVLHESVRTALKAITDDPLMGLKKDTFGRASSKFKVDGVEVQVTSDPSNRMYMWSEETRISFEVSSRMAVYFIDTMSEEWTIQVLSNNRGNIDYRGPLSGWVPYLSVQSVVDKILKALKDLPGPDSFTEKSYPRGFSFTLDKNHTFKRSDYESDEDFEQAIMDANDQDLQAQWEQQDIRLRVVSTPAKAKRFMDLGIPKCTSNKKKQQPKLSLPMNKLRAMHEAVKAKIEELKGVYEHPPHDNLIDEKTLKKTAKARAQELVEIHNGFYSQAAFASGYYHWDLPQIDTW